MPATQRAVVLMDAQTLVAAMLGPSRLSLARAQQLIPGLHKAMALAHLDTVNRRAMFLAQCGEESGSLRYTEELASGSEYEGRADLGNTQPGDGVRFKGRSYIQITGRHNYLSLSGWAHAKGIVDSPTYFVDHPAALARDEYVWLGPVWYWTVARPGLNGMADAGDVAGATRAINGGMNGYDDRLHRWTVCKQLGDRLMGDEFGMDDANFTKLVNAALDAHTSSPAFKQAVQAAVLGIEVGLPGHDAEPKQSVATLLRRLRSLFSKQGV